MLMVLEERGHANMQVQLSKVFAIMGKNPYFSLKVVEPMDSTRQELTQIRR